jgi:3-oxoacyl-[acyl-carrier-protein] synthase I
MVTIYKLSDNIISSLGFSTEENFDSILNEKSGIGRYENLFGIPDIFHVAAIDNQRLEDEFSALEIPGRYTRFEKLVLTSITYSAKGTDVDLASPDTLFILSTTKGNIDLLDDPGYQGFEKNRLYLWKSAQMICRFFKNPSPPLVVSNACISGVSAILVAKHMIESGKYSNVVVAGADIISKFTLSGFYSFKALSASRCKPFDAGRDGLNLGEGAGTLIVSSRKPEKGPVISFNAGSTSNDANHISGPSRTGEGLLKAIEDTLKDVDPGEIGFINAHGTATPYNDEMEAIALSRAGLNHLPVNSLKGYIGHTLGAAGVIESILCTGSLERNMIIKSLGYHNLGVTVSLNVADSHSPLFKNTCLKTASGFGGCNASLLIKKSN